jgi:uncharacterized protein (UPF0262 family)
MKIIKAPNYFINGWEESLGYLDKVADIINKPEIKYITRDSRRGGVDSVHHIFKEARYYLTPLKRKLLDYNLELSGICRRKVWVIFMINNSSLTDNILMYDYNKKVIKSYNMIEKFTLDFKNFISSKLRSPNEMEES